MTELGHYGDVVAPGLVPRSATGRVKTDRRDVLKLARLHRAGELTPVWVTCPEQEAMRDLTLAQEDMIALQTKARQRLSAFLLRHSRIYPDKSRWTQAHKTWLSDQFFDHPVQQMVFQECVDACCEMARRIASLDDQIRTATASWSLATMVEALISLRGLDVLSAVTVLAELGDITRFDNPRQLMSFLGLVPSKHSSGAITKTGNGHVRRILVEAAWNDHFPACKPHHLNTKAKAAPERVQTIGWQTQKRLCSRYRRLRIANTHPCKVTTAVARELVGFIWATVCEVADRPHASRALA
ncbi:MAG: IS110 family transposase [Aestuariivita sp.]|nr:IS110 family transposase [Aestuariivita sp.]